MFRLQYLVLLCLFPQLYGAVTIRGNTDTEVAVCLRQDVSIPFDLLMQGENTASELFNDIAIRIRWTCNDKASCIKVRLRENTPTDFHRGAFAYAVPYAHEGDRVIIFYDRFAPMAMNTPRVAAIVFGHILAHEIAHVLGGVASHTSSGLMGARWTDEDYQDMMSHKLRFTPELASFIHRSLATTEKTMLARVN